MIAVILSQNCCIFLRAGPWPSIVFIACNSPIQLAHSDSAAVLCIRRHFLILCACVYSTQCLATGSSPDRWGEPFVHYLEIVCSGICAIETDCTGLECETIDIIHGAMPRLWTAGQWRFNWTGCFHWYCHYISKWTVNSPELLPLWYGLGIYPHDLTICTALLHCIHV